MGENFKSTRYPAFRLSVAPMMDWTDRHCRMFHRQFSQHVLLYTEMVTSAALVHGDAERLLQFNEVEHPVALQLGGSDPEELANAVSVAKPFGYDEFNLNIGCPSDRVQSGCFGAVLMRDPDLVADCVSAMSSAADGTEVTVKCRIGVDDQEPGDALPEFLARISSSGIRRVAIHARKAWLQGLSPKENRDIPPLDYGLVQCMKGMFPGLEISVNGGITSLDHAEEFLDAGLDGVMIGRAAYHDTAAILGSADRRIYRADATDVSAEAAVETMLPYIEDQLTKGVRLNQITRHMLGAFSGRPGARQWRRELSEGAHLENAGPDLVSHALSHITRLAA